MKKSLLTILFAGSLVCMNAQNAITDGDFELGTPSTAWVEASTNFGTPFCDAGCGTCGGPCAPANGTWYTWFGGIGSDEVASVTQTFNVGTAGAGSIDFNYMIATTQATGTDSIVILLDGVIVMAKTDLDTAANYYTTYDLLTFPLGTVSAGSHTLEIYGHTYGPAVTNFLVDDVTVNIGGSSGFTNYDFENGITINTDNVNNQLNLMFNFSNAYNLTLSLIDMTGKVVATENYSNVLNGTQQINTSELSAGVYNVIIDKGSERITKKVVVE